VRNRRRLRAHEYLNVEDDVQADAILRAARRTIYIPSAENRRFVSTKSAIN
jgi:hypothetical protein